MAPPRTLRLLTALAALASLCPATPLAADLPPGAERRLGDLRWPAHDAQVLALSWTAAGVDAVEQGGMGRRVDPATGRVIARWRTDPRERTLHPATSADGRRLALWEAGRLALYALPDGRALCALRFRRRLTAAALSPDGRRAYCATDDGQLYRVAPDSGRLWELARLPAGPSTLACGTGDRLAAGLGDGRVALLHEGKTRWLTAHTGRVALLAFSPDGRWLASCSARALHRHPTRRSAPPRTLRLPWSPRGLAWRPDGVRLAVVGPRSVRVLATDGPAALTLSGYHAATGAIAWSPDGTQLALVDGRRVRVRAARGGPLVPDWPLGQVTGLAWLGADRLAAVGTGPQCAVWRLGGGPPAVRPLTARTGAPRLLSASGQLLLIASRVQVRLDADATPRAAWSTRSIGPHALSPDGRELIGGGPALTRVALDTLRAGSPLSAGGGVIFGPLTASRTRIATGDGTGAIRLYPRSGDRLECQLIRRPLTALSALAFAADPRTLAAARVDGALELWDVDRRTVREIGRPAAPATVLAWSADGRVLASGHADGQVRLWGPAGRRRVLDGHTHAVRALAWSSSGRLASGGEDRTIVVWRPID